MPSTTRLAKWLFVLCMIALGGPSCFAQTSSTADDTQKDEAVKDAAKTALPDQAAPGDQAATAEAASNDEPADKPVADKPAADLLIDRKYQRAMIIDIEGPIFGSLKSYLNNRIEVASAAMSI